MSPATRSAVRRVSKVRSRSTSAPLVTADGELGGEEGGDAVAAA
jgi:hypothetical protein